LSDIVVADSYNHRVQIFDAEGNFLHKFGSDGSGDGQFSFPKGVAISKAGNIIVTDYNNHRVQIF
jgi:tripartite motif-containing protein 71